MVSHAAYLQAMGIVVWTQRQPRQEVISEIPAPSFNGNDLDTPAHSDEKTKPDDVATLDWEALRSQVAACKKCELHKTRTQTVFGVGDPHADWLFIGEAPGADEDRQGEPFVGRAGQLLNNMIKALGLSRDRVYIANILKCRPPRNRDPLPEESQTCRPYLQRQIELLAPRIIVALGRVAAQNLLQTDTPIGRMRGRQYIYEKSDIPVIVTYHPAYLLRSPREKRKVWQDLCRANELLNMP
jgi:DNA polymerase